MLTGACCHVEADRQSAPVREKAADALFRQDPRWLGADAAYSTLLGKSRVLWLFGDTFIASAPPYLRSKSRMIRNSIAIQNGTDVENAAMQFHWGRGADGKPESFFAESRNRWYWPGHAYRVPGGPLFIFLSRMKCTNDNVLGFANDGWALVRVENPDAPPAEWRMHLTPGPRESFDATPGAAVWREGGDLITLAVRQRGSHAGYLVRYRLADLSRDVLSAGRWWNGTESGWVASETLGRVGPNVVIPEAGAECSIHWDKHVQRYLHVTSCGFGASVIAIRTAPRLTGPWSDAQVVFKPEESSEAGAFVYAAKAQPELSVPGRDDRLVLTYVANRFIPSEILTSSGQERYYWPRVVSIPRKVVKN